MQFTAASFGPVFALAGIHLKFNQYTVPKLLFPMVTSSVMNLFNSSQLK